MFKFISSWDDGRKEDIGLSMMLKQFKIPAIFFIPSNCQLTEGQIKDLSKHFGIGGHTQSHPEDMKLLSSERQFDEIRDNKVWLEKIVGKELEWFCYPSGRYNEITIEAVKRAGFKYARTVVPLCISKPIDNFRIATTIHVHPNKREYEERNWIDVAKEYYQKAKKEEGLFHLWGHSFELEKYQIWEELDDFLKFVSEN